MITVIVTEWGTLSRSAEEFLMDDAGRAAVQHGQQAAPDGRSAAFSAAL